MSRDISKTFNKLALIADIMNSKEIEDRNDFQIKLKILLESINYRYSEDLAVGFRISKGDELEAVFHSVDCVMEILDEINLSLYPVKIRWGMGLGKIETTSSILREREVDGSMYAYAREALKRVKHKDNYGKSLISFKSSTENSKNESLLNSIFQLQDSIRLSWTFDQSYIIQYLIKEYAYGSFVQKDVAERLDLSQQRISNVFAATSFKQYASSRKLCTQLLLEEQSKE